MSGEEAWRVFAQTGAAEAFARVVEEYAELVYAAARRQVGDVHLAEDVTQAVFIILAKKARKIGPGVVVAGWLVHATYFAASNALKLEARRRRHERRAAAMRTEAVRAGVEDFEGLGPHLNGALARLGAAERDAVVLRFMQDKTYADVSAMMGVTEAAARKRVERGLARLRTMLSRRGVKASEAGLEGALARPRASGMPGGMVAGLAAKALAGAKGAAVVGGATTGVSISKGAMTMMMWTKMKVAAVVGVVVMLAAGGGAVVVRELRAQEGTVEVAVPGPRGAGRRVTPAPAPAAGATGPVHVKVVDEAGKPVRGAEVKVVVNTNTLQRMFMNAAGSQDVTGMDGTTKALQNFETVRNGNVVRAAERNTLLSADVFISADGYGALYLRGVDIQTRDEVQVVLKRGERVKGVLKNERGEAVAGATMWAIPPEIKGFKDFAVKSVTGSDGGFEFLLGEGAFSISADLPVLGESVMGFDVDVTVGRAVAPLSVVAYKGVVLRGTLDVPAGLDATQILMAGKVRLPEEQKVEVRVHDGVFEATGIPAGSPGEITIRGKQRPEPFAEYGMHIEKKPEVAGLEVHYDEIGFAGLPAGVYDVGKIEFLKFGRIKGVVRDGIGAGARAAKVAVKGTSIYVNAQQDGSYEGRAPAMETVQLEISRPRVRGAEDLETVTSPPLFLKSGQTMQMDFVLRPFAMMGQSLSGRVVDENGNVVPAASVLMGSSELLDETTVQAVGVKRPWEWWGRGWPLVNKTDGDGQFTFPLLSKGSSDVWVRVGEKGAWVSGARTGGEPVELKLAALGERVGYAGRVVDANGQAAGKVRVLLSMDGKLSPEGPAAHVVAATETDGAGRFVLAFDEGKAGEERDARLILVPEKGSAVRHTVPWMEVKGMEIGLRPEAAVVTVAGTVRAAGAMTPIAGARVRAMYGDMVIWETVADAGGHYEVFSDRTSAFTQLRLEATAGEAVGTRGLGAAGGVKRRDRVEEVDVVVGESGGAVP